MQLDATLRSLCLHCRDISALRLKALYVTSEERYERQYQQLMGEYPFVEFVRERSFQHQLLSMLHSCAFVLFLVDDNLFVRNFSILEIARCLQNNHDVLGFSLRLGENTHYCYPQDREQKLPEWTRLEAGFLKYKWSEADGDFAYPLEVSSSVYRGEDVWPLLTRHTFTNPNTLEAQLAACVHRFVHKSYLLCHIHSLTFCNPINRVQKVYPNRSGEKVHVSPQQLGRLFDQGYRIAVEKYIGFIPDACHQEVELELKLSTAE